MPIKDRIIRLISLEEKKTEIIVTIFSLLIQSISILVIIKTSDIFQEITFWIIFTLSLFLVFIIFFQFYKNELILEAVRLTIQFTPEYEGIIEELFSGLNIPSVNILDNKIKFETLDFSIRDNSNSLEIQTSERTEKVVSKMYKDLRVFKERFEDVINESDDQSLNILKLHCELDLKLRDRKSIKKNITEMESKTFDQGLTIIKTKEDIKIIIPANCYYKPWKDLRKLILN